MAVLKIVRMGNPVLTDRADEVSDPTASEIRRLAADMIETMHDAGGAGLAAPQVAVPLRLFVFHVSEDRVDPDDPYDGPLPMTALVNPEIEVLGPETEISFEGCLSIPGMIGAVRRPLRIRYRGVTPEGERIEREARGGLHARVIQHEYDHLDGVLYPMRVHDPRFFGYCEEIEEALAAAHEDVEATEAADTTEATGATETVETTESTG
jgi:peptide deformylase